MKRFLLLPALLAMFQVQAQQIEEYRYWINDDPAGVTVSGIGPNVQVNLVSDLVLSSLTQDYNTITIQFKDTNDVYSVPVSKIFTRNTGAVTGYEYWIDDAIASRVTATVTPANTVILSQNIPLCLTAGTHLFTIRFQGASGTWSVPITRQFTATASADTDGDGLCNALDPCPLLANVVPGQSCDDNNACTVNDVIGSNCACAGTFADADNDGTCDASDLCPGGPEPGTACNDNNGATINDIIQANCSCAGTLLGNDCNGVPGGTALPGTPCNDSNACTVNDVYGTNCLCAGTFADADNDGTCDASDLCSGGPEPGTACNDNNANTINDVIGANCQCTGTPLSNDCNGTPGGPALPGTPCNDGNACTTNDTWSAGCVCVGGAPLVCNDNDPCTLDSCNPATGCVFTPVPDTDGDGTCDATDGCPNDVNKTAPGTCGCGNREPGSACNDNNANTTNDVIGANCLCAGTPIGGGCTTNLLNLAIEADGVSTTTYEVRAQGSGSLVLSGGQLYAAGDHTVNLCLPNGCYYLRVLDNGGDGITGGGYVLRTATGKRIIDDLDNFVSGSVSAIANNEGFCLPLGTDGLIYTSCDKLDWVTNNYMVASPNPLVSAQYGVTSATSGYEFWFFNPNGGYSFRKFRAHNVSDGFAPDNYERACHIKLNNWAVASQIPNNVLLNVRVRGRIAGVNNAWGPACRMKIDPVRAACPLTKLLDIPGEPNLSCGSTRAWGNGNYIYARPVTGANKYQFRFRIPGEPFEAVRTSNTYILQLNWITNPLVSGIAYNVDVRASKNNGATWCTDPAPIANPWGDVCQLTINNTPANSGNQNMMAEDAETQLHMYPNPNRGDQLYLSLDAVEEGVSTVSVDIFDLFGKRMSASTIAVNDTFINTVIDLDGNMANGMYIASITAGRNIYTERLVIQK